MRDLSLHVLDLIENAVRARATTIAVTVEANVAQDTLRIVIEDNGCGLSVSPADVADPFYTTKAGKRTGLGLSLFRASAEQAGGVMVVGRSVLGGVAVAAEMRLNHVDRLPLGDLAATLASVVCTNPRIDFRFHLVIDGRICDIRVRDLAAAHGVEADDGLALARRVTAELNAAMEGCEVLR